MAKRTGPQSDGEFEADQETILLFDVSNPDELNESRIEDPSGNGNDGKLHNAWWLK